MNTVGADAAAWYRRTYPAAPTHNARCLATLAAWQPDLRNIVRRGVHQADGGFEEDAAGVRVRLAPGAALATYDDDGLTRLVLAAHLYACRVELRHEPTGGTTLTVHPRQHSGKRMHERHPDLPHLAARARMTAARYISGRGVPARAVE